MEDFWRKFGKHFWREFRNHHGDYNRINPIDCNLVKKDTFRSGSLVNMNDDRMRVTIDIDRRDWSKLKSLLNIIEDLTK